LDPIITNGGHYVDHRGVLIHNNNFDASDVKRLYIIENNSNIIRRWQGHRIEQRWFSAIKGGFEIQLIRIDDWVNPSKKLKKETFNISDKNLDILHIPDGYVTSIKSLKKESKLLIMSDYKLDEIKDDYKFPSNYFE
jgi:dTDP-4-dehydrorhamnose 3,5-epimerase-like enzyme